MHASLRRNFSDVGLLTNRAVRRIISTVISLAIILTTMTFPSLADTPTQSEAMNDLWRYAFVTFGNFEHDTSKGAEGTHCIGPVAVGGTFAVADYGFANSKAGELGMPQLLVAGNATATNVHTMNGDLIISSTSTVSGSWEFQPGYKQDRRESLPFDFTIEKANMISLASEINTFSQINASDINQSGSTATMNGTNPTINIFQINASDNISDINIVCPEGSQIIINIVGSGSFVMPRTSVNGNQLSGEPGGMDSLLLWNCSDLSSISASYTSVHGAILAPKADITFNSGNTNGTVICQSFFGSAEIHWAGYTGGFDFIETPNRTPDAVDDSVETNEDTPIDIIVLSNDTDPDQNPISISAVTTPGNGTAVKNADGSVTYTPSGNWSGEDAFQYTITDGNGGSDTATVTVIVNAVNDPPTVINYKVETNKNTPVSGTVKGEDIDGGELTYAPSSTGSPIHGTVEVEPTGVWTYTPNKGYVGADRFAVLVSDGHGGTATSTIEVQVNNLLTPPEANDDLSTTPEDTSVSIPVLSNDTDPDDDVLTITRIVTDPTKGSVEIKNGSTVLYTPNENANGEDSFSYEISDGNKGTSQANVTVQIEPVNDVPTVINYSVSTNQNNPVSGKVVGEDLDRDALLYSQSVNPLYGTVSIAENGDWTYVPTDGYIGQDSFAVLVSDGNQGEATSVVTIDVLPALPYANDDNTTTDEDLAVEIDVLKNDTDPNSDNLTIVSASNPSKGTVDIKDGRITYTPNINMNGSDIFTYEITDGKNGFDSATVTIVIRPVNDAPIAQDDSISVAEDHTVRIPVLTNDSDPESDLIVINPITQFPLHGTVTINRIDNTISYTPDPNWNGSDSFVYEITDHIGGSDTAVVSVTVLPVNDSPVTKDYSVTTKEDTSVSGNIEATDSDGDVLLYTVKVAPAHGNVTLNGDNWEYTPNTGYNGPDNFCVEVSDQKDGKAISTVDILVNDIPHAPVALDDSSKLQEDKSVIIKVLDNDSDPDMDSLTVTEIIIQPTVGHVSINTDNTVTYTPKSNATGTDSFTYKIDDGNEGFATATVSIVILAENDAPILTDYERITKKNTPVNGTVIAIDVDGDDLTYQRIADVANGIVVVNPDGSWLYTPNTNFYGTDSFRVEVSDGKSGFATSTVTIIVNDVLHAPVAVPDSAIVGEDDAVVIDVLKNDSDVDGDQLTISKITKLPGKGVAGINTNGTISYEPKDNEIGEDTFIYEISDGKGGTSTALVSVIITPKNDIPTVGNYQVQTNRDSSVGGKVEGNDIDGDSLTYTIDQTASNGTVTVNPDGTWLYNPTTGFVGVDSFIVIVGDGHGGSVYSTVQVTVIDVQYAPIANPDVATTNDKTAIVIEVIKNDTDPNDDSLTIIAIPSQPGIGSAEISADGQTITYFPSENAGNLTSFTYQISDGHNGTATAMVTIHIDAVNDAPTISDYEKTTAEDTPVSGTVAGSDKDGDPLTYTSLTPAEHGRIVVDSKGDWSYTPDKNYVGDDSFVVQVSDSHGGTAASTIDIHVTPVNDAPVAADYQVSTPEDTSVSGKIEASDEDNDPLTFTKETDPRNGSVSIDTDGVWTYTPALNFVGNDSFTVRVSDGTVSKTATVNISVTPQNDAPSAADDNKTTQEDTPISGIVQATDADQDKLTFEPGLPALHGTVLINTDGSWTYSPNPDYVGMDDFTIEVTDPYQATDSARIEITVTPRNDAPTVLDYEVITPEDTPVSGVIVGSDIDTGDVLTYALSGVPTFGTISVDEKGSWTYSPSENYVGEDHFTVLVSDKAGATAISVIKISISPVEDTPVAEDDTKATPEGTPVTIDVLSNDTDPDGDDLIISAIVVQPSNGTVTIDIDGRLLYTPVDDYAGTDSLTYKISDGNGGNDEANVTITISELADLPVAENDSANVTEDYPVRVSVLANDVDKDGDDLSITSITVEANNGTTSINQDGTITYLPYVNFVGTDHFTYEISDGNGGTDTAVVTITVSPVNDAPTVPDYEVTTEEDIPVSGAIVGFDPDGDFLTYTVKSNPKHGQITVLTDGSWVYQPQQNFNGIDQFLVQVTDTNRAQVVSTVTINILPVQDPPLAVLDAASTKEDVPVLIPVLTNDTDPDGDNLTVTKITTNPLHGTVVVNEDKTVTYTPDPEFNGNDIFTYEITDGNECTDTADVTIQVNSINDAPEAKDDEATTNEDTSIVIRVLDNDTDLDGDKMIVSKIMIQPQNGTVVINKDGTVLYTPIDHFFGTDTFTYEMTDGHEGEDTAVVVVTVVPMNDPPEVPNYSETTMQDIPVSGTVIGSDIDHDDLSYEGGSSPTNGSVVLNPDGSWTYTPNPGFSGDDSFTVVASDGNGGTATSVIVISVGKENAPPEAPNYSLKTPANTPIDGAVKGEDPEGEVVSYEIGVPPEHGKVVLNPDGSYTYTPDPGYVGEDSFTIIVTEPGPDGKRTSSKIEIDVTSGVLGASRDKAGITKTGEAENIFTSTIGMALVLFAVAMFVIFTKRRWHLR